MFVDAALQIDRRMACFLTAVLSCGHSPLLAETNSPSDRWKTIFRTMHRKREEIVSYNCRIEIDMQLVKSDFRPTHVRDHFSASKSYLTVQMSRFGKFIAYQKWTAGNELLAASWSSASRNFIYSKPQNLIASVKVAAEQIPSINATGFFGEMCDPLALGFGFVGDHLLGCEVKDLIAQHHDWADHLQPTISETADGAIELLADTTRIVIDPTRDYWPIEYIYHSHTPLPFSQVHWKTDLQLVSDRWLLKTSTMTFSVANELYFERKYSLSWTRLDDGIETPLDLVRKFANRHGIRFAVFDGETLPVK